MTYIKSLITSPMSSPQLLYIEHAFFITLITGLNTDHSFLFCLWHLLICSPNFLPHRAKISVLTYNFPLAKCRLVFKLHRYECGTFSQIGAIVSRVVAARKLLSRKYAHFFLFGHYLDFDYVIEKMSCSWLWICTGNMLYTF